MNRQQRRQAQRAWVQAPRPSPTHVHALVSLPELCAQAYHAATDWSLYGDLSNCQDIRLVDGVAAVIAEVGEAPDTTPAERAALVTLLRMGWIARLFSALQGDIRVGDELVEV